MSLEGPETGALDSRRSRSLLDEWKQRLQKSEDPLSPEGNESKSSYVPKDDNYVFSVSRVDKLKQHRLQQTDDLSQYSHIDIVDRYCCQCDEIRVDLTTSKACKICGHDFCSSCTCIVIEKQIEIGRRAPMPLAELDNRAVAVSEDVESFASCRDLPWGMTESERHKFLTEFLDEVALVNENKYQWFHQLQIPENALYRISKVLVRVIQSWSKAMATSRPEFVKLVSEITVGMMKEQLQKLTSSERGTVMLSGFAPVESATKSSEPFVQSIYKCLRSTMTEPDLIRLRVRFWNVFMHNWGSQNLMIPELKIRNTHPKFVIRLDLMYFIHMYGESFKSFREVLAITGTARDAQITTIGSYFKQTWPTNANCLLDILEDSIKAYREKGYSKGSVTQIIGCVISKIYGSNRQKDLEFTIFPL